MGRDFAELVASEFEAALARDPQLDLRAYAERRVKELHRPAAIIFPDGTAVAPEGTEVPRGHALPGPFRRRGAAVRGGRPGGPGGPADGPGVGLAIAAVRRHRRPPAVRRPMAACRACSVRRGADR